ncbi:MAG: Lnb N-terminal periplasmic domain-containing protein [Gammaproteobacteria bacterium]
MNVTIWRSVSMGKIIKTILMGSTVMGSTLWGLCAVYFGDSHSGIVQTCASVLFGLCGLAALIALGLSRWRRRCLAAYSFFFAAILTWWLLISPSNARQWQPDVAKLAYAALDGDKVTVHNIRNFDYRSENDYQPGYYTKTFDLNKLKGVDLIAVYWMGPAIAHTMLSFDFGGNDHLAVSIEARKEMGEGYSTIKGFFRQYELIYIVADERDVIRLRTNYRKDPPEQVHLYRLQGPLENGRRLFMEYIKKINALNDKPAFYNTLIDNCTTAVWLNTRINPKHLPFSWKVLLSGYLPEYLYESGRLDSRVPFSEIQKQAHINSRAQAADQAADFSALIRAAMS